MLLPGGLQLRLDGNRLYGEVLDPDPGAHRCEKEFDVLLENARRAFDGHPLAAMLSQRPQWRIVESLGPE